MSGTKSTQKERQGIIDAIRQSPVVFIMRYLKEPDGRACEPHVGQIELLMLLIAGVTDMVIAAGRQWGKSHVLAWYIVWFMLRYPNRQVWIVAPTLDQARIIFNEVSAHFRSYPLNVMLNKRITDFPFPHIELLNGSECHARGANSPQYIRGKPAHLIIEDEAAFIKDGVHPNVIEPMLTVTGRMEGSATIRISTPFGQGDFFDGAIAAQKDKSGRSKFLHFSSLDNPHADKDRLFRIRDRYGESSLLWQTEYMANFADSDMAVFSWADIKYAYENFAGYTEKGNLLWPVPAKQAHRYVQGTDLANRRDFFVNTVLDVTDPMYSPMVRMDRLQQKGYAHYKDLIRRTYTSYNSPKTLIDATSLGESVVEDLSDIGAEGYTYTSTSKYDVVHNLVRMFNQHQIGIPFIREIVDELRYFEYIITPSKTVKMEAKQGHDDIVMSLALAGQLASQPYRTGFFLPVNMNPYGTQRVLDFDPREDPD